MNGTAAAQPREQHKEEEKRERILKAAERLFLRKGAGATSVDMIVEQTRISKGDFYLHFRNKDDVFLAVARRLILPQAERHPQLDGPLAEQLAALAPLIRYGQVQHPGIGILRAAIETTRFSPDLARQVYFARAAGAESIVQLLRDAAEQDGASFDDANLCAYRFAALATDGLRHLAGLPMPDSERRLVFGRYVVDIFLHGYGHRPNKVDGADTLALAESGWSAPRATVPELPPTRKPQQLWETVLDRAWEVFREQGYVAASMDGIADLAGLPKNTIYRRFGSKAGLFLFTAKRRIDLMLAEPVRFDRKAGDSCDMLAGVMRQIQQRFCTDDCLALSRMLIVGAGEDLAVASAACEYLAEQAVDALKPIVNSLIASGEMRGDTSPDIAAWQMFVLATFGSRYLFVPPQSDAEEAALAREAAAQLLYGVFRN